MWYSLVSNAEGLLFFQSLNESQNEKFIVDQLLELQHGCIVVSCGTGDTNLQFKNIKGMNWSFDYLKKGFTANEKHNTL